MADPPRDVTRATLAVLVAAILGLCTLWVLRPFLSATVWATTIVVATWPLLLRVQAFLWHSRKLAVGVTTLVILLIFVAPFWLAMATILAHADQLSGLVRDAAAFRPPAPPVWLHDLPLVGPNLAEAWARVEEAGLSVMAPLIHRYGGWLTHRLMTALGSIGLLLVQVLLTVVIVGILHANGEAAARLVLRFGHRLAGDRGTQMVVLSGDAIRAVAIGVMVTALVECVIGGLGLAVVGVPLAAVLTAVMFVCCVAQAGPGFVLIPAVVWMYVFRTAGPATLLLAVSLIAITIDNVLRPVLIRKEADLPMLLVLAGVIGGLAGFGLIGVFVGPVVLAVSTTLLKAWMAEDDATARPQEANQAPLDV